MQQGLSMVQASVDNGADEGYHRLIRQPELRVFWRKFFKSDHKVRMMVWQSCTLKPACCEPAV